jgi:xanthine dehydrogenase YagS FAD-binding subunit
VALLVYDAVVEVHGRGTLTVADIYGDGSDPSRDHLLAPGEILTAVRLPPPVAGERAAHHRVTSRADGEWPLVEVVARVVTDGTLVTSAAVAAGAVARTPLRLSSVEEALTGAVAIPATLEAAADHATDGCVPLSGNAYKIGLLRDTTLEVLERALL